MNEEKKQLKKSQLIQKCICMIFIMAVCFSVTNTAFAAGLLSKAGLEGSSGPLATIYKIYVGVSIPLAVLGVGMCAIGIFFGGEDAMRKIKKYLINIGVGLVVLMLIPRLLIFATNNVSSGWKADGSGTSIISNAFGSGESSSMANQDPLSGGGGS